MKLKMCSETLPKKFKSYVRQLQRCGGCDSNNSSFPKLYSEWHLRQQSSGRTGEIAVSLVTNVELKDKRQLT